MTKEAEPVTRHEVILRLPNLTAPAAELLVKRLSPYAEKLGGSLSEITREDRDGFAMHKGRRKHV